ncbi:MAG: YqeG family HAD IIIA-type phosphatase [Armatimonadota bacterium]
MPSLIHQFCPQLRAGRVWEIEPSLLTERGVRAVILDLDNTLVPWHGNDPAPRAVEWIRALRDAGIRLCIVSNTHRPGRLRKLAETLGIDYVPSGGKPRRRGFLHALRLMKVEAGEAAVVGDQVFTDIWGGNRCGLLTILVAPLSPREFWGTRVVSRNLERAMLRMLERQGLEAEELSASRSKGEA